MPSYAFGDSFAVWPKAKIEKAGKKPPLFQLFWFWSG
jgi:hypothetical protein